jgi:hydrogenase maturation protease
MTCDRVSRLHVSRFTSSRSRPSSVLILGLGNLLRGDDGIGPRLIEELNRRGLPKGITALDGGTAGFDLLNMLEGYERVVIVDAAEIGQEPGQFVRFTPGEVRLAGSTDTLSLHHAGLAEALALAEALGQPLPEIVIFGVQPAQIEWGEKLTPAVEAVLPDLVETVLEEALESVSVIRKT